MARRLRSFTYQVTKLTAGSLAPVTDGWVYMLRAGAIPAETKVIPGGGGTLAVRDCGHLRASDVVQVGIDETRKGTISAVDHVNNVLTFSGATASLTFNTDDDSTRVVLDRTVVASRLYAFQDPSGTTVRTGYDRGTVGAGFLATPSDGSVWAFVEPDDFDVYVLAPGLATEIEASRQRSTSQRELHITEFEVTGGAADESAAVQRAVDYCGPRNIALVIPGMTVRVDAGIVIPASGLRMYGTDRVRSKLKTTVATNLVTAHASASVMDISNMTLEGALSAKGLVTPTGVNVLISLKNMYFLSFTTCVEINCQNAAVDDLYLTAFTDVGLDLRNNYARVSRLRALLTGHGVRIANNGSGNVLLGCVCGASSASTDGFHIEAGCDRNYLIGCTGIGSRYGVNIAGATADANQIIGGSFIGNVTGSINDLGTGTIILAET